MLEVHIDRPALAHRKHATRSVVREDVVIERPRFGGVYFSASLRHVRNLTNGVCGCNQRCLCRVGARSRDRFQFRKPCLTANLRVRRVGLVPITLVDREEKR